MNAEHEHWLLQRSNSRRLSQNDVTFTTEMNNKMLFPGLLIKLDCNHYLSPDRNSPVYILTRCSPIIIVCYVDEISRYIIENDPTNLHL